MCGIAGMWRWDGQPIEADRLRGMADAVRHRGPDGEGIWVEGGLGLAHRRLAIIDLSSRAAQPMVSADERYVITFNGEIYNYRELRALCEASGSVFRSDSDTEVLLHLYARKRDKMLADLRGMFALAIWDREERRLFMARDRLGKKPFFYQRTTSALTFASEIKAVLGRDRPRIDEQAIRVFLGLQYVPTPLTGFVGIECLPPGYAATLDRDGRWDSWQYDDVFQVAPFSGSFAEAKQRLRSLLEDAIKLRLVADVPVGAFLSGGLDSATVVALMRRLSQSEVSTFTMGFPALGFDERPQAADMAKQLGTKHAAFEAQPGQAVEMLDALVALYDAPYADSSCLPTWLLARETAGHVKVVLTGDGADELFAGYHRYAHFVRALRWSRTPLFQATPWMEIVGQLVQDQRFIRFARMLALARRSPQAAYAALFTGAYFSAADEASLLTPDFAERTRDWSTEHWMTERLADGDPLSAALAFDRTSYLPDDLNVKMDRATMAHGLEARAPFLDQDVARFAASLPTEWLLHGSQGKYILKEAMADVLPREALSRRKRGFQVPLARWFRKELRPVFVERCLSERSAIGPIGPIGLIFLPEALQRLLAANDAGADHGNRLWMLLTLASWLERQR